MTTLRCAVCFFLFSALSLQAQNLLQSGPMVGYTEMHEAMLWVQSSAAAKVYFEYYDSLAPSHRYRTNVVQTEASEAFTAHCVADSVQQGHRYFYDVFINDTKVSRPYPTTFRTPPLWQFRTDPPQFRICFGSCAYINETDDDRPGTPYGGDYQIFTAMAAAHPDITLWLGDNVYLREPDWNSRSGILHRYTHTRSLPEMQPLLASCANYAIWDDHDFGPNDCDRGFWNKEQTFDAFKLFWANPRYGMDNNSRGINSYFSFGDVDVFLLDDRWWRSPDKRKNCDRTILGKEQFDWLLDNLASSTAAIKLVCIGGQVLNSEAVFENYATYGEERQRLIDAIHAEGVSGVVFLSGDRHHTELSILNDKGFYPLYDITSSPFTAGPNPKAANEPNKNRVSGTFVGQHNYALLDFKGSRTDRVMVISDYDANGTQMWSKEISLKDMKTKQ